MSNAAALLDAVRGTAAWAAPAITEKAIAAQGISDCVRILGLLDK
jgi:hypothetical protein